MLTFVLIRAGEGETKEIWVAHGTTLAALAQVVVNSCNAAIAAMPGPYRPGTHGFMAEERDALVAMLPDDPCPPGRYLLAPIHPVWEQCTLLITDPVSWSVDSPSS